MKVSRIKVLTLILTLILLVSAFTSCDLRPWNKEQEIHSIGSLTTEVYDVEDSSFVKVEAVKIYEGIYFNRRPIESSDIKEDSFDESTKVKPTAVNVDSDVPNEDGNENYSSVFYVEGYLLVKFRVIKDYYNKIADDTEVTVPIIVSKIKYDNEGPDSAVLLDTDRDEVVEMINSWDHAFYYFSGGLKNKHYYSEDGEQTEFIHTVSNMAISNHLFPIVSGALDDDALEPLSNKTTPSTDYSEYFRDGMTEGELIESIERLYREQMEEGKTE